MPECLAIIQHVLFVYEYNWHDMYPITSNWDGFELILHHTPHTVYVYK